jgi:hypothetical protein
MFLFENDSIKTNEKKAEYDHIGNVTFERFNGSVPFYGFYTEYGYLLKNQEKFCGGNCLKFITDHFDLHWHST